jgi:DNA-directed RNA polymerase subunit K/omega
VSSLIKAVLGWFFCVAGVSSRWTRPALAALSSLGKEVHVIWRPDRSNAFEFVVVSALRAAQLMRGCTPRVAPGYKHITTAQMEVAAGKVVKVSELEGEREG